MLGAALLGSAGCTDSSNDDPAGEQTGTGSGTDNDGNDNDGNDPEENPDDAVLSQLLGTWETYKEYYGDEQEWDENFGTEHGYVSTKVFRADGSCTFRHEEIAGSYVSSSDYAFSVASGIITISAQQDPGQTAGEEIARLRIESLTDRELVLAQDRTGSSGATYTDKEYLKRID